MLFVISERRVGEPERAWLLRIPGCESSWHPDEPPNREGATGLYQFLPSTYEGVEREWPYGWHPIYSARWQTEAAHWVYRRDGGGREWECK